MDALKTKELARMLRHHAEGGDARAVNLVQKTLWMLSFLEDSADEIPTATGDELCVPIKGRLLSLEGLLELVAREANANVSIKGSHFKTARETEEDVGGMLSEMASLLEGLEAPLGIRGKVHNLVSGLTNIPDSTMQYPPETHTDIRRISSWLVKQRAEMETATQSKKKPTAAAAPVPVPKPISTEMQEPAFMASGNTITPEEASVLRRTLTSEMAGIK